MQFKKDIPLSRFSHYKIGGVARFFFEPKNEKEITWAITEAKANKVPVFILGGGTNLLLSDDGFQGLVIKPALMDVKAKGARVNVGAGVLMADLLQYTVKNAMSGLEWAGGLPGTFGGAIRGNAGCFGGEIKDAIISVRSFNPKTMKFVERSAQACAFHYRDSIFKHKGANEIIVSAQLQMARGKATLIKSSIQEKIAHRTKHHPLEYPNIGSMFKNIPLTNLHPASSKAYHAALAKGELSFRGSHFSVKTDPFPVISAAKLISESGLSGVSFGGAMISAKHPNFIVNALEATAFDIKTLLTLAKSTVQQKFGVTLEEEVQIVDSLPETLVNS
jgi:UDP-N-acetylmuramate dehydrogenase